ncbi:MAG: glycosyltransferase family 2 protein [Candidatus Yanofskybacteria bacterium]|nr:glycosyltransferase family 2 protein [Candidatus Yanofskybacteria bacterium]
MPPKLQTADKVLVSIIIPVYNEERFVAKVIERVLEADLGFSNTHKEIVVVNDGSSDNTFSEISKFENSIKIVSLDKNQGKGTALRKGFAIANGDILLIQDADFEYDPKDYHELLKPIIENKADVVYGSRFIGGQSHRVLFFWHYLANLFLTLLSNMFSNLNLTDMETGYKAFRKEAINSISLKETRFGFEPEVTIKLAQQGWKFYEIGISYNGRSYAEGKKISWIDAARALFVIFKYGLNKQAVAIILIAILLISGSLGVSKDIIRFFKQIPPALSQELPGQKFTPLISYVANKKEVGFLDNNEQQEYLKDFYQAQNILAPVIIKEGSESEFIIVSNYRPSSINELKTKLNAEVIAEFHQGSIYLLQKNGY